jgi:ribosomal protein L7/L12
MADGLTQEQVAQIESTLAAGRKIEAIKIYRKATGKGLKEAKDFVEVLIAKLIEQDPQRYAILSKARGAGCASVVSARAGLAVAITKWILG